MTFARSDDHFSFSTLYTGEIRKLLTKDTPLPRLTLEVYGFTSETIKIIFESVLAQFYEPRSFYCRWFSVKRLDIRDWTILGSIF